MPPIYYLNQPPHPFWDFVAGIEDHPFFAHYRRPVPSTPPPQPPRPEAGQSQARAQAHDAAAAQANEKAKGKQAETSNVEDPPEIDPATLASEPPKKATAAVAVDEAVTVTATVTVTTITMAPIPGGLDHPLSSSALMVPSASVTTGPKAMKVLKATVPAPDSVAAEAFIEEAVEDHTIIMDIMDLTHAPRHAAAAHSPRLGVDLTSAAEGLGLRSSPRSVETDFEPRTDIFDTAAAYVIHLSLPGAKKSDVGVDWDGEHSVVRVAGVVHRPNVDEEMMSRLVVDGRKRETGVFEKTIRLGTPRDPASVDVDGITAKMVDGVLIIRVPKVEKTFEKKEVHVGSPSPARPNERPEDAYMNEKDLLFDAADDDDEDRDMYDAEPIPEPHQQQQQHSAPADTTMGEQKHREAKEEEALRERERDNRSETVDFETPAPNNETTETLPRYEAEDSKAQDHHHHHQRAGVDNDQDNMSDWEKYGSEDEGEYVKINVD
ncbi:hypothetical protein AYO22_10676 [Fonsecaea multimorphosa]|nr:hypothetical protein AYO22_10676 [Fonsecaea multimorphosa]